MFRLSRPPAYCSPREVKDEIIMYLHPKQQPPALPLELRGYISPKLWASRTSTIEKVGFRYSRPVFEIVWAVLGLVTTLIIPVALHQYIKTQTDLADRHYDHKMRARVAGFAIFFAFVALFIVPLVVWKFIGQRSMNRTVREWETADRITSGPAALISSWKVTMPGPFRSRICLRIKRPASSSLFDPNAHLPSYINAPTEADETYFYPYKQQPGLPRMSVVGNVPIFTNENMKHC